MLRPRDEFNVPAWEFARLRDAPWLVGFEDVLSLYASCTDWPTAEEHNAVLKEFELTNASGMRLRFEPTETRRSRRKAPRVVDVSTTYDGNVAIRGIVPTRDRVPHDFFNALSWAAFPQTKRTINRLQIDALQRRIGSAAARVPNARSRDEDLLTMLDEGGLIRGTHAFVFGHALMEHFYTTPLPVRAFSVGMDNTRSRREVDAELAERLQGGVSAIDPGGAEGTLVSAAFDAL